MKLFECPVLTNTGINIILGFVEEKFQFICLEVYDNVGNLVWSRFITSENLFPTVLSSWRPSTKQYDDYSTFLNKFSINCSLVS